MKEPRVMCSGAQKPEPFAQSLLPPAADMRSAWDRHSFAFLFLLFRILSFRRTSFRFV